MEDFSLFESGVWYICLLFALCAHEASHALMADWCGDPSPRFMGRVTLNPLAHIDPIGTVVMPLLMVVTNVGFLLGWAKPVPFNPMNLKNIRRDPVLIALAGPAANLLLALVCVVVLRVAVTIFGVDAVTDGSVGYVIYQLMFINAALLLFNLMPFPPLDGHYVLHYFLPPTGQKVLDSIGPFGIIIVVIVVYNTNIFSAPLSAFVTALDYIAFWGAA